MPSFKQQPALSPFHFLLFLCVLLLLLSPNASALPTDVRRRTTSTIMRRQDSGITSPTTVHTQRTYNTPVGPMTETCVITLSPITDAQGQPAVQEVRSCTIALGSGDGSDAGASASSTSSSDSASATTTTSTSTTDGTADATSSASDSGATASASLPPLTVPTDSATSSPSATSSDSNSNSAAPTGSAAPAVVVNGVSSVAVTTTFPTAPLSSGAPIASSTAVLSLTSAAESLPSASALSASALSATAPSGSAAAAQAASTQAAFTLPGKKLSVLPIGLGVFAGISVIALIVVGLVTYERTKYRKAFRQRKLAEAGGGMGYGGMAERT